MTLMFLNIANSTIWLSDMMTRPAGCSIVYSCMLSIKYIYKKTVFIVCLTIHVVIAFRALFRSLYN